MAKSIELAVSYTDYVRTEDAARRVDFDAAIIRAAHRDRDGADYDVQSETRTLYFVFSSRDALANAARRIRAALGRKVSVVEPPL